MVRRTIESRRTCGNHQAYGLSGAMPPPIDTQQSVGLTTSRGGEGRFLGCVEGLTARWVKFSVGQIELSGNSHADWSKGPLT